MKALEEDELLATFGVPISEKHLPEVRELLATQVALEAKRQGAGSTEVMRLLCVQLFSAGKLEDVERIWNAKSASADAHASIEIGLLCGAGLEETKRYLETHEAAWSSDALRSLESSRVAGDFEGFSVQGALQEYVAYYTG